MQSALTDLEALMSQAQAMVNLASSMNAKLSENPNSADSKDAITIQASLQAMGMTDVVITPDMARDSQHYAKQLATELESVLKRRSILEEKGMVGLDEIWCIWNRARGVCASTLCHSPKLAE